MFVIVKKGGELGDGEEVAEQVTVDGACIRTPEEDILWAEKQKELEADAAKGAKGKAPAKKKWFLIISFKYERKY